MNPDQNFSSSSLNDRDHVVGDLRSTSYRVVTAGVQKVFVNLGRKIKRIVPYVLLTQALYLECLYLECTYIEYLYIENTYMSNTFISKMHLCRKPKSENLLNLNICFRKKCCLFVRSFECLY